MFFGAANVDDVPIRFSGTIGFRFLTDNLGAPGTSLLLGSDSTVQLVNKQYNNFGTAEYRFLVNLGSIPLTAETYWLALHEGPMGTSFDGTEIFWNTTSSAPSGTTARTLTHLTVWPACLHERRRSRAFHLGHAAQRRRTSPPPPHSPQRLRTATNERVEC